MRKQADSDVHRPPAVAEGVASAEGWGTEVPNTEDNQNDKVDLTELVKLAADRNPESREKVFRETMDVLLHPDRREDQPEYTLAADILRRLLKEVETRLRWELASRLADRPDSPPELIKALAVDEIEVAFPVLQSSPIFKDEDLIEIILTASQAHQLAIARRESLSESVSQALFDTDDTAVIKALLNNANAKMTPTMLEFLVEESKWQHVYQEPLVRRWDLPIDLARKLYWWVAAPLKLQLVERFDVDPDDLDEAISKMVDESMVEIAQRQAKPTKTQALVDELHGRGELTVSFLLNALSHGEIGLFEDGLIRLSGLRPSLVKQLIHEATGRALAVLCRALGASSSDFVSMYAMTRHTGGKPRPISRNERREIAAMYREITETIARKVMRRWNRDPEYSRALDAVATVLAEQQQDTARA